MITTYDVHLRALMWRSCHPQAPAGSFCCVQWIGRQHSAWHICNRSTSTPTRHAPHCWKCRSYISAKLQPGLAEPSFAREIPQILLCHAMHELCKGCPHPKGLCAAWSIPSRLRCYAKPCNVHRAANLECRTPGAWCPCSLPPSQEALPQAAPCQTPSGQVSQSCPWQALCPAQCPAQCPCPALPFLPHLRRPRPRHQPAPRPHLPQVPLLFSFWRIKL